MDVYVVWRRLEQKGHFSSYALELWHYIRHFQHMQRARRTNKSKEKDTKTRPHEGERRNV